MPPKKENRYKQLIESIFFEHYKENLAEFPFTKDEYEEKAAELGIKLPKNSPDVIYSFRYRVAIPERILKTAPTGKHWITRGTGKGTYNFSLVTELSFKPSENFAETKILDSTPGVISKYALDDEQSLLAKVRFNRLIDLFTGLVCYSLQNHLRTSVAGIGQVETDEIYVGVDKKGSHYIIPVQAKGGRDKLGQVQIEQDVSLCAEKFPGLICKPIAAQFLPNGIIVLFELDSANDIISVVSEKHYRLVPPAELSSDDLESYRHRFE